MTKIAELRPAKADGNLLDMEEDLSAVKSLAFAVNLISCSENGPEFDALWQIARQIENHADALKEKWEAARKKLASAA
jgi:hypothetical protein